jgi:hypothetical protein
MPKAKKSIYRPENGIVQSAAESYNAIRDKIVGPYVYGLARTHPLEKAADDHDRARRRANPTTLQKAPTDHAGVVLSLNKMADNLTKAVHDHPNKDEHPELHAHVSNVRLAAAKYSKSYIEGSHSDQIKYQINTATND